MGEKVRRRVKVMVSEKREFGEKSGMRNRDDKKGKVFLTSYGCWNIIRGNIFWIIGI